MAVFDKPEDQKIRVLTGTYLSLAPSFNSASSVELDLGCGKGGFAAALGKTFPDRRILAADVMIGRLRKLVRRLDREGVENVEPLRVEARRLVCKLLPDQCVRRLHVLCPDPWPKKRHRGHRLVCSDFLGQVNRVLKPGGTFHFATDDDRYFDAVADLAAKLPKWRRDDSAIADLAGLKTDFETRWLDQGRRVRHAAWTRH